MSGVRWRKDEVRPLVGVIFIQCYSLSDCSGVEPVKTCQLYGTLKALPNTGRKQSRRNWPEPKSIWKKIARTGCVRWSRKTPSLRRSCISQPIDFAAKNKVNDSERNARWLTIHAQLTWFAGRWYRRPVSESRLDQQHRAPEPVNDLVHTGIGYNVQRACTVIIPNFVNFLSLPAILVESCVRWTNEQ